MRSKINPNREGRPLLTLTQDPHPRPPPPKNFHRNPKSYPFLLQNFCRQHSVKNNQELSLIQTLAFFNLLVSLLFLICLAGPKYKTKTGFRLHDIPVKRCAGLCVYMCVQEQVCVQVLVHVNLCVCVWVWALDKKVEKMLRGRKGEKGERKRLFPNIS